MAPIPPLATGASALVLTMALASLLSSRLAAAATVSFFTDASCATRATNSYGNFFSATAFTDICLLSSPVMPYPLALTSCSASSSTFAQFYPSRYGSVTRSPHCARRVPTYLDNLTFTTSCAAVPASVLPSLGLSSASFAMLTDTSCTSTAGSSVYYDVVLYNDTGCTETLSLMAAAPIGTCWVGAYSMAYSTKLATVSGTSQATFSAYLDPLCATNQVFSTPPLSPNVCTPFSASLFLGVVAVKVVPAAPFPPPPAPYVPAYVSVKYYSGTSCAGQPSATSIQISGCFQQDSMSSAGLVCLTNSTGILNFFLSTNCDGNTIYNSIPALNNNEIGCSLSGGNNAQSAVCVTGTPPTAMEPGVTFRDYPAEGCTGAYIQSTTYSTPFYSDGKLSCIFGTLKNETSGQVIHGGSVCTVAASPSTPDLRGSTLTTCVGDTVTPSPSPQPPSSTPQPPKASGSARRATLAAAAVVATMLVAVTQFLL